MEFGLESNLHRLLNKEDTPTRQGQSQARSSGKLEAQSQGLPGGWAMRAPERAVLSWNHRNSSRGCIFCCLEAQVFPYFFHCALSMRAAPAYHLMITKFFLGGRGWQFLNQSF